MTQDPTPKRPGSDFRGHLLPSIAALFAILVFAISANTLPAALLRAAAEFGIDPPTKLSDAFAAQFAAFVLVTIIGGVLADYFGKKLMFLLAGAVMTAGAVLWYAAPGRFVGLTGSVLLGMGGGVIESMCSAVLVDLYPTRRKLMLNLSQVMYCAGAVGGPALMGWLMPRGISWRVFFLALGVCSALMTGLFAASHLPPPDHEERIDPAKLRAIATRPSFLLPCLILFLYVLGESGVGFFMNYHLREHLAAPESWAIYAISAFWLAMALGRMICAAIPERVSYEWVIGGLSLAAAGTLVAQRFVTSWQMSFVWFALSGLAMAGTWPLIVGLTAHRNPKHSGSVMGGAIACGAMGCVLASWFMTTLYATLPVAWVFPAAGLPMVVAGGLSLYMLRMPSP